MAVQPGKMYSSHPWPVLWTVSHRRHLIWDRQHYPFDTYRRRCAVAFVCCCCAADPELHPRRLCSCCRRGNLGGLCARIAKVAVTPVPLHNRFEASAMNCAFKGHSFTLNTEMSPLQFNQCRVGNPHLQQVKDRIKLHTAEILTSSKEGNSSTPSS